MNFQNVKSLKIPAGTVKRIVGEAGLLWKSGWENLLKKATDLDRVTVYGGVGYLAGKRINSSGSVVDCTDYPTNCASGFIPCKPGDVLRVKNFSTKQYNCYVVTFDSANNKTAQVQIHARNMDEFDNSTSDYYFSETLSASVYGENFNAVRINGVFDADTVVTVNEEITP